MKRVFVAVKYDVEYKEIEDELRVRDYIATLTYYNSDVIHWMREDENAFELEEDILIECQKRAADEEDYAVAEFVRELLKMKPKYDAIVRIEFC